MANRPLNVLWCHLLIRTFHAARTFLFALQEPITPLTVESFPLFAKINHRINDFQWVVKKTLTCAPRILYFLQLSARHKAPCFMGMFPACPCVSCAALTRKFMLPECKECLIPIGAYFAPVVRTVEEMQKFHYIQKLIENLHSHCQTQKPELYR